MALVEKIILTGLLMIVMFGLGATVTKKDVYAVMNYKRAFFVGVTTQFGFMAFLGWAMSRMFMLSTAQALGTIVPAPPRGEHTRFFSVITPMGI